MPARWNEQPNPGFPATPAMANAKTLGPSADPGLDPYVRWAMHTQWRGFARLAGWDREDPPDKEVRIIACAPTIQALETVLNESLKGTAVMRIPDVYFRPIPGTGEHSLHFTATVPRSRLDELLKNPWKLKWKLALPMRDAERASYGTSKGLFGPDRDRTQLQAENIVAIPIREAGPPDHPSTLSGAIALIDYGCPFLHEAFAKAGAARVAALWDQGSAPERPQVQSWQPRDWPWAKPLHFDHGRELGPRMIQTLVDAAHDGALSLDERDIYRSIDYLIDYQDPRRRVWFASHGGHLLDVMGGNVDPLTGNHAGAASQAPLIFVQLPLINAMDSGGGSLAPHLLDGVRYALELTDPDHPLVVNISYGGQAGPHDGSSLVEAAMDELLLRRPRNFAIVLAAGNARKARCHASRRLLAGRSVQLRLLAPEGDTTDSFVEVWYRAPALSGIRVECRVRSPSMLWSPWVPAGQEIVLRANEPQMDVVGLLRHDFRVPNGDRPLILLALAPTAQPDDVSCSLCEAGEWAIELRQVCANGIPQTEELEVEAWIERDDPSRGSSRSVARFVDQMAGDDLDTRSSIASGQRTIVVGGYNLGTGDEVSYSARGSARVQGTELLAACEQDETLPSIGAAATRSGEIHRLNGTSVAAPVLARRLYEAMLEANAAEQAGLETETDPVAIAQILAQPGTFIKVIDRS